MTGRRCNQCRSGYWNLESSRGCRSCVCNNEGSLNAECDAHTGQCKCQPGVGGTECDRCLSDHYGFSANGCKSNFLYVSKAKLSFLKTFVLLLECDQCTNSAYICDPDTGRCVCPLLSKGADCQQCYPNAWGWEHRKGCTVRAFTSNYHNF